MVRRHREGSKPQEKRGESVGKAEEILGRYEKNVAASPPHRTSVSLLWPLSSTPYILRGSARSPASQGRACPDPCSIEAARPGDRRPSVRGVAIDLHEAFARPRARRARRAKPVEMSVCGAARSHRYRLASARNLPSIASRIPTHSPTRCRSRLCRSVLRGSAIPSDDTPQPRGARIEAAPSRFGDHG